MCSLRTKYTADKISRHASRQEREVKDDNDDMEVNDLEAPDSTGSPVNATSRLENKTRHSSSEVQVR